MSSRAYLRSLRKGRVLVAVIIVLVVDRGGRDGRRRHEQSNGKPRASRQARPRHATVLDELPPHGPPGTRWEGPAARAPRREDRQRASGPSPERPQRGRHRLRHARPRGGSSATSPSSSATRPRSSARSGRSAGSTGTSSRSSSTSSSPTSAASQPNQDRPSPRCRSSTTPTRSSTTPRTSRTPSRTAPDSTYAVGGDAVAPLRLPPATYSRSSPTRRRPLPVGGLTRPHALAINFSEGTDVVWKWDPSTGQWIHTYSGVTDVDALTDQPVTTTNIVVQIVHYTLGPYNEDPQPHSGDVESQTVGTGVGLGAPRTARRSPSSGTAPRPPRPRPTPRKPASPSTSTPGVPGSSSSSTRRRSPGASRSRANRRVPALGARGS